MAAEVRRRRFTPPWSVEETLACFVVKDFRGAYVYFEEEPGRQSAANQLTRDEARGIATILLSRPDPDRTLDGISEFQN